MIQNIHQSTLTNSLVVFTIGQFRTEEILARDHYWIKVPMAALAWSAGRLM